jgi:4-cresol dehydrogenase (hydroxylating)
LRFDPDGLQSAFAEWREALGEDRVVAADRAAQLYGPNTIGIERAIPAAVLPRDAREVQAVVRTARVHGVPLYAVSTGHNWGYGAANPVRDGCVVVDLSGMDRVVEMDSELGLVTVQPGVTQRGLRDYLDRHGQSFLVPVHGGGGECSLIGNALERGYGITPHADHFGALTALEAVLPDGRLYRSALSEIGGERLDRAFKWGFGPYLDGLFTQGNLGIVTQATIALAPVPERIEAFFFSLKREQDLEDGVALLQSVLRRVGGVCGSINLMNAHRMLSMAEPFPSDRVPRGELMPETLLAEMASRHGVTPWTGFGALYGSRPVVAAARGVVKRILRGHVSRLIFVTPAKVARLYRLFARRPLNRLANLAHLLERVDASMRIIEGTPSDIALPLAYWRSGVLPEAGGDLDPARDGCGLIWYAPLVPMAPGRVRAFVDMVRRLCLEHRIEPLITLTSLSERCFDSTVPLLFDRADVDDVARAQACYDCLLEAGMAEGFVPYRTSVRSMSRFIDPGGAFWSLVSDLKRAVDPGDILSPGRYCPSGEGGVDAP